MPNSDLCIVSTAGGALGLVCGARSICMPHTKAAISCLSPPDMCLPCIAYRGLNDLLCPAMNKLLFINMQWIVSPMHNEGTNMYKC